MALQEELETQGNFLFRYRGVLPIFILALGIAAYMDYVMHQDYKDSFNNAYNVCCLMLTIFGLLIRIYTVGYSAKNTSGRNTEGQLADELNTSGIYSVVRHPLYVGNFFMWMGIALLSQNIWFIIAFIFMYWVYYERIMFAEEQFLRKKFGNAYLNWAHAIPAFIPRFKNYRKPVAPFNSRKVIRQEKTGVMLVFVLYFIFDQIHLDVSLKKFSFEYDLWFFAMLASICAYLVIKILQKFTMILAR